MFTRRVKDLRVVQSLMLMNNSVITFSDSDYVFMNNSVLFKMFDFNNLKNGILMFIDMFLLGKHRRVWYQWVGRKQLWDLAPWLGKMWRWGIMIRIRIPTTTIKDIFIQTWNTSILFTPFEGHFFPDIFYLEHEILKYYFTSMNITFILAWNTIIQFYFHEGHFYLDKKF